MAAFEIHEHSRIAPGSPSKVAHSHPDAMKHHNNYGPATFTIDRRHWLFKTGLRGGGTKRFTAKPHGTQLD